MMKLTFSSFLVAASSSFFWSRPVFATQTDFDIWNAITPSTTLNWTPCYKIPLECTRLLVPLDYSEPNGTQAAIAVIRRPALVPSNSSEYRGPVLFNPGGPGGPGVNFVLNRPSSTFAAIIGPQFDLVGFDQRGSGRSTPTVSFFETAVERQLFTGTALPVLHNDTLAQQIIAPRAASLLLNILAGARDNGTLRHMNTPNTATDMLSIVQAHGRDKLQYWGMAYGSVIGATFAAMYPDKIERLVFDSVLDPVDWYRLPNVPVNPGNSAEALDIFFQNCADAGPDSCAFWKPKAEDISKRLEALYLKLRAKPIPVKVNETYGIVNEAFLRETVYFDILYPQDYWVNLAIALKQLEAGDASGILLMSASPPFQCSCEPEGNVFDVVFDGANAVTCNDGAAVSSPSNAITKYLRGLSEVNPYPEILGANYFDCLGWPISHNGSFSGPFVGETSFPLLFFSHTADSFGSLRSAQETARGFKGAVVFTQDSVGLSSFNNPSNCTNQFMQQYFQNGTLPPPNTVCHPNIPNPFLPPSDGSQNLTYRALDGVRDGVSKVVEPFIVPMRRRRRL